MSAKKTVLLFGEAVSLAHVVRPLVLAQALDPEQYDIHFACDPRYSALIGASPHIRHWPIHSVSSEAFIAAANQGDFGLSDDDLDGYIAEELHLLHELRPSLVVSDFRPTMSVSAELTRTLHATLANVHWSPYRSLGFDTNAGIDLPATRRSASAALNAIRQRYDLPLVQGYCDLITRGDFTLYAEPPGFVGTTPMPDRHIFLGPIIWSPDIPKPAWWQTWAPELPLIYVTLGSTGLVSQLPDLLAGLADLPATILVATAGRADLDGHFDNVYAVDYLPGQEISRLVAVVVCNGGSATAYQALSQGAPVVALWSNIDQYLTAGSIAQAGAGLSCRASETGPETMRQLVATVLADPAYRRRATELSVSFNAHDAGANFRDFVARITG